MNEQSPPSATDTASPRGAGWSPFPLITGTLVLIWSLRATVFVRVDDAISSFAVSLIFGNLVKAAIFVVPVLVFETVYRSRSPLRQFRLSTIPNAIGLLWTAFLIPTFLVASIVVDGLINWRLPHLTNDPFWFLLLTAVSIAFSAFCEEIFCRGFILGQLWERMRFWPANLVTSLLFTCIHWPIWIHTKGFQLSLLTDTVWIFGGGLMFGFVVKLNNSLWPAVLLHALVNFVIVVVIT